MYTVVWLLNGHKNTSHPTDQHIDKGGIEEVNYFWPEVERVYTPNLSGAIYVGRHCLKYSINFHRLIIIRTNEYEHCTVSKSTLRYEISQVYCKS